MPNFRFYHPIEVRYADLDPQGHVNNAKYLTYIEIGRIEYFVHLGLWSGDSFVDIGVILAAIQIDFREPIYYRQPIQVGVRVESIGNKSIKIACAIEDARDGRVLATASNVLVGYDYHSGQTVPVPDSWRKTIMDFEELTETKREQQ